MSLMHDINAMFKRGFATSLFAVYAIMVMEVVVLGLTSDAFSILSWIQYAEALIFGIGTFGILGIGLSILENLLGAVLLRLDVVFVSPMARVLIVAAAGVVSLGPLALLAASLSPEPLIELIGIGIPIIFMVSMVLLRRRMNALVERRVRGPVSLFVFSLIGAFVVLALVGNHKVVERLQADRYAVLALSYFAVLIAAGFGLTFAIYWISRKKFEGYQGTRPARFRGVNVALAVVCVAVAAAFHVADLRIFPGLYSEFHLLLKVLTYFAFQLAAIFAVAAVERTSLVCWASALAGSRPATAVFFVAVFSCIGYTMARFDGHSQVSAICMSKTVVMREAIIAERSIFDFDNDGFSSILGGGDCDDLNPDIHPEQSERLDNGIDDNCFGGDLTSKALDDHRARLSAIQTEISDWWETSSHNTRIQFNVVVITVDALRADHVGFWGYHRNTTPRIDALAERSVVFKNAYCQGGWTSISLPSLLKGLYPSEIRFTNVYEDSFLRLWFPGEIPPNANPLKMFTVPAFDSNESMVEILRQNQYHTIAVLNDDYTDYFQEKFGYVKGFDVYYNNNIARISKDPRIKANSFSAEHVTRGAIRELNLVPKDKRFFMWIHHFDPHSPYERHESHDWGEQTIDRYDSEISYTDRWIGEFLDALDERGLLENTVVALTADHGEAFGEHGTWFHGTGGWQEEIRIPLILHVPGFKHDVIDENVALIDLAPTLLDLAGIRAKTVFSGRSLLPLVFGKRDRHERDIVTMTWRYSMNGDRDLSITTLIRRSHKLIHDEVARSYELYDLSTDPGEKRNITDISPRLFRELVQAVRSHSERSREDALGVIRYDRRGRRLP